MARIGRIGRFHHRGVFFGLHHLQGGWLTLVLLLVVVVVLVLALRRRR